jgi:hypothetical protein
MPTGRVPGVRGRARTQPGWVRSQIQYENRTRFSILQFINMRMSLILLICSTRSLSRSCSTSGTSHHGQQRLQEAGGVVHTNNRHINKKQPAIIDHAWSRVRWILRFILLSFHFLYFIVYFYFTLLTPHIIFIFSCKCRSIR